MGLKEIGKSFDCGPWQSYCIYHVLTSEVFAYMARHGTGLMFQ